jgi:hypothetical protein
MMRKIKLVVETLAVESFAVDADAGELGTVNAHASGPMGCSADTLCGVRTCLGVTCDYTLCRPCPTA